MDNTEHRWTRRYPELARFGSSREADAVFWSWQKAMLKKPRFWLALLGYTAIVGIFVSATLILMRRWVQFPMSMFGGIVGGVTGGSGTVALTWLWRRQCRAFLREELVDRGVAICVKCGCDLRGQSVARCPECGAAFDSGLIAGSSDPDLTA